MREYRGKAISTGKWIHGDLIRWGDRRFIFTMPDYSNLQWLKDEIFNAETLIEVIPESVGQYTGLKFQEKEVWEHDQFKGQETGNIYTVIFREGEFILVYNSISPPVKDYKFCNLSYGLFCCTFEAIGSTTDSPDLLESPK